VYLIDKCEWLKSIILIKMIDYSEIETKSTKLLHSKFFFE